MVPRERLVAMALALELCASSAALGPAKAAEVTVQNDSVTDFSQVSIQAGFVGNEQAAAWLTSPCDGDIVAVQVFWRSLLGGAPDTLGNAILVSQAGAFPVPGTLLANLSGPLMQDGFMNEFRFLDEDNTIPLLVPVTQGQVFVVSFQFFDPPGASGPSVVTDVSGCQASKNGIFAIPPSVWFNACSLGVTGDFVIRAVVDCAEELILIFADGFESGDTTAWTVTVP